MARNSPDYLKQPYTEQLEYFQEKLNIPLETLEGIKAEYHDFAFSISGLTKAQLVEDVRWLVDRSIEQGNDLEDFKKQFRRLISRKGWKPYDPESKQEHNRLRIILETNARRSHGAGRHKQMREPEVMTRYPGRMWRHRDSPQPRPLHKAIDGKVFPSDSVFWDVVGDGMCGYGCRCTSFLVSDRQLKQMGKTIEKPPPPDTIAEAGFRRAPGTTPIEERKKVIKEALEKQSPELRKLVTKDLEKKGVL